jgi:hypothetical protein
MPRRAVSSADDLLEVSEHFMGPKFRDSSGELVRE